MKIVQKDIEVYVGLEEIINLLNTWNLIDKKSDSGDAQYVKQIL